MYSNNNLGTHYAVNAHTKYEILSALLLEQIVLIWF